MSQTVALLRDSRGRFIKGHSLGPRFGYGQKAFVIPKGAHMSPKTEFKKGHIPVKKGQNNVKCICANCSMVFYPKDFVRRKYCSECKSSYNKGVNNPSWRGGKPKCRDCGIELSTYRSKTYLCRRCVGRILSENCKGEKNHMFGKKLTKEQIKKCLTRRPMSSLEIKVLKVIDKYQLPYKFVGNGKFFIERKNPDFVNTNGEKKAVEVYWKRQKEEFRNGGTIAWMEERKQIFERYGWEIIFIEGTGLTEKKTLEYLGKGVD